MLPYLYVEVDKDMTTCPTCAAQNDASNRFCDQCGSRLDVAPSAAPATGGVVPPDQPTMVATSCPKCSAVILPGEAFCDNCGADLTSMPADPTSVTAEAPAVIPTPVSADAPTMLASMPVVTPAEPPAPSKGGALCPACGQTNLPGEQFCDNCGADLLASAPAPAPAVESRPVVSPDDATILAPLPVFPVESLPPIVPPTLPDDATMLALAPIIAPVDTSVPAPDLTPEPPPAPAAEIEVAPIPVAADPDPAAYRARKAELETEIARQQQIIAQFEQMQAMFGATTPPAVTTGLAEARVALAQAEADLAGLVPPPVPAVDPEAVRQLEAEIGRQQQIIAQFGQMQAMFGAATPPAVTAGLAEAHAALAKAEADLAALTGGVPTTIAAPVMPVASATPDSPPPPAPVVAPALTPRLVVVDGGQALNLPTDRVEIIIGREDPVSNIFPEVDLTSFGGESGGVSRQHAKITHRGDQWMIADLNSTNFTRVDGVRLEPHVDTPLHDGARVQFGRIITTFHI